MNRRTAIRNVVIISAGAVLLPSCLQEETPSILLKNISITGSQQKLLAALCNTIIPKTKFIGAADVMAHEFTLLMVDDCNGPDVQQKFTSGLVQFDKLAKNKFDRSFTKLSDAEKKEFLTAIENKINIPGDVLEFYQTTKKYTVQAFTTSKVYMTDVRHYKLVPGSNFKGCVPLVKKAS